MFIVWTWASSGIVVMGRGVKAQRALSIVLEQRKVSKRYQALVDGIGGPSWRTAAP
jgi:23S rRNA-/tRNA-specific pseudouridylate synthase